MVNKDLMKEIKEKTQVCKICGKSYLRGHPSQIFCSVKCRDRNYAVTHKEKVNEQIKKWKHKNKERINERSRELYKQNAKSFLEKARKYREANREEINRKRKLIYALGKKKLKAMK